MATRRAFSATGNVALALLNLTIESAEVFPPLKSVAAGAFYIIELVKNFGTNKDQWQAFGAYVQNAAASVVESLAQADEGKCNPQKNLIKLRLFLRDPEIIAEMRMRIGDDMDLFQLNTTVTTMVDVGKTFEAMVTNGTTLLKIAEETSAVMINTASIARKASVLRTNAILDKLPRAKGASWDPSRVCMPNTRVELVNDIMTRLNRPTELDKSPEFGDPEIILLTAVAGVGKSTVAHTIAWKCQEQNQLGSSFFFDREIDGRNTPDSLFTSIAADLSRLDVDLGERIACAMEKDRSLLSAPLSRQFEELILKPLQLSRISRSLVLVIDALDEAGSQDLFVILRDRTPELPRTIRIFLTSRTSPELNNLVREPHVTWIELNVNAQFNMNDIAVYAPSRLQKLAKQRELGDEWAGPQLQAIFLAKAEGLFLWVATVCDYLGHCEDPLEELIRLLATSDHYACSAGDKMNRLYTRILEGFNWGDARFVASYRRVMGTAIASKRPLTIAAMSRFYPNTPLASDFTLQRLGSLLTGMRKEEHRTQPVQILHQSLRHFLVDQTSNSGNEVHFKIAEQEHSKRLGLLCLELINRDLKAEAFCAGYLTTSDPLPKIPTIKNDQIAEELLYACQFWQDHVSDMQSSNDIEEVLKIFMDQKLTLWMELVAACGTYQGLEMIQNWGQRVGLDVMPSTPRRAESFARACLLLSRSLCYKGRREEALAAGEDSVHIYRKLAADRPTAFAPSLAKSLNDVSLRLNDLGRQEEALMAVEEAVAIRRRLSLDHPTVFEPQLALSLTDHSIILSRLGCREEALATVEEAVQLYRQHAADLPAELKPDMAKSLHCLSNHLGELGRCEEALTVITEALRLRRQLNPSHSAASLSGLAGTLSNLCGCLSDVGRGKEALDAIVEAVQLYRQLAVGRPAAYKADLSASLNNLSNHLVTFNRREEALAAIKEAVILRRQLVAERPLSYTSDLAMSLNNFSVRLSDSSYHEEALAAIEEALSLYRQLTAARPASFTPGLAGVLDNLASRHSRLGRSQEALVAIEEAVQLRQKLAADRPAAFTPALADSLHNLSIRMSKLGRYDDALSAVRESVILRLPLAEKLPLRFKNDLKNSLVLLSQVLARLGRREEAAQAKAKIDGL
ncbi:POC1 centriolar protein A [Ceratobasidium sp. 395]|nr:POC1 centriolar protein A [Ceratobasidium sp. 395]